MILFVNACVRSSSRTKRLADFVLGTLDGDIKEIRLEDTVFPHADEDFILRRSELAASGDFSDGIFDLAKDFAAAGTIVIAAPFWDLSFPSSLKQYIEQVCVTGLTFTYRDNRPVGLCRAEKLIYITTAGGYISSYDYGFGYIREIACIFFGIPEVKFVSAEGLDIIGADTEAILKSAEERFLS